MKREDPATIRFFDAHGMDGLRAVHAVDVASDFPRHAHGGFCIGLVHKGARVICQNGASTVVPENGVFLLAPGISHACKAPYGRHSYFGVCVDAARMKDAASQVSGKEAPVPCFKDIPVHDKDLAARLSRLIPLVEAPGGAMEKESALNALLSALVIRYGDGTPVPIRHRPHTGTIARARDFIEANYTQDLSLGQLARETRLSPFYFQRLFLAETGVSPHDYLVQCRIRHARKLLAEGHAIAETALDTGFVDQSHFTRSFKRIMGITPGAYLREEKR